MSVITSYDIRSEKDMVSKLESIGALKKGKSFEIINYVPDENGYCHEEGTKTCYCATLDFSKLWTEDWAKYSEDIKKHGVINCDKSILDRIDDYCMMEYIRTQMEKPVIPEGRTFSHYYNCDGEYGYCTRNINYDIESSEFTKFDAKTMEEIRNGAKKLSSMWKLTEFDDGRRLPKRDLTEYEISKLALYSVNVSDDGKLITYSRNYAHGMDDAVPSYVSKALSDEKLRVTICTEAMCDYDGYIEDAKYGPNLTPSRREQEEALYGA